MAEIHISCSCGKRYRTTDAMAGKQLKCPSCGRLHTIEAPQEPPAFSVADLLDEPERARPPAAPARTSVLPTMRDPNLPTTPERQRLHAELQVLRQQMVGNASELGTLAGISRAQSDRAAGIEAHPEQQPSSNGRLGGAAGFAVGGVEGMIVGAAVDSLFSGKARMSSDQRAAFDVATGDANAFSGAAMKVRGSIKALQRRQTALEALRKGDDGPLAWVHRVGAGLLASLLFAGLGLVTLGSALIHPLLAIVFLPFCALAPWIWWRSDLQPLGAALRDHPGVYRPGESRLSQSPFYPLLCILSLMCGTITSAAAVFKLWQYGLTLVAG